MDYIVTAKTGGMRDISRNDEFGDPESSEASLVFQETKAIVTVK